MGKKWRLETMTEPGASHLAYLGHGLMTLTEVHSLFTSSPTIFYVAFEFFCFISLMSNALQFDLVSFGHGQLSGLVPGHLSAIDVVGLVGTPPFRRTWQLQDD